MDLLWMAKGVKIVEISVECSSTWGKSQRNMGADILRLWAASVDYQADCSMSDEIMKQVSENYRKVRNTFRFLLANINPETDFTKEDLVDVKELSLLDKYMLIRLYEVNEKAKKDI